MALFVLSGCEMAASVVDVGHAAHYVRLRRFVTTSHPEEYSSIQMSLRLVQHAHIHIIHLAYTPENMGHFCYPALRHLDCHRHQ